MVTGYKPYVTRRRSIVVAAPQDCLLSPAWLSSTTKHIYVAEGCSWGWSCRFKCPQRYACLPDSRNCPPLHYIREGHLDNVIKGVLCELASTDLQVQVDLCSKVVVVTMVVSIAVFVPWAALQC
jgi:hypothetical protein